MSKKGNYGVTDIQKEFLNIIRRDYPETAKKLLYEMANRTLARVKKKTPVDEGFLRRSWQLSDLKKDGNDYTIIVFSDMDYAEYVEYGHKVKGGVFVKGVFMLTLSIKELERDMPKLVKKFYNEVLKEFKL